MGNPGGIVRRGGLEGRLDGYGDPGRHAGRPDEGARFGLYGTGLGPRTKEEVYCERTPMDS